MTRRYSSKYVGVSWNKTLSRWQAYVGFEGRRRWLGAFRSEAEAAEARRRAVEELGLSKPLIRPTPEERFWAKVVKSEDGCWEWRAACHPKGYGEFGFNRRVMGAHRFSWELAYGPIPNGMCVCHKCDNPSCVRPDHLFLGTIADNTRDMVAKGRSSRRLGEQSPNAKITEEIVREIRHRAATEAISHEMLAKDYPIGQPMVSRIIRRVSWSHVE